MWIKKKNNFTLFFSLGFDFIDKIPRLKFIWIIIYWCIFALLMCAKLKYARRGEGRGMEEAKEEKRVRGKMRAKVSLCITGEIFQMNAKCKHRSGPAIWGARSIQKRDPEDENDYYQINSEKNVWMPLPMHNAFLIKEQNKEKQSSKKPRPIYVAKHDV